jgi:hypothetical protein
MVSDKKIFMGIPLGFYVKLSSAVAAMVIPTSNQDGYQDKNRKGG